MSLLTLGHVDFGPCLMADAWTPRSVLIMPKLDPGEMVDLGRMLSDARSMPITLLPAEPAQLWGFFHTTCIYESAAALVSLHRTKAGAWRAMWRRQWECWETLRSPSMTHMHLDRETRRCMRDEKVYESERSHVRAVEVLP